MLRDQRCQCVFGIPKHTGNGLWQFAGQLAHLTRERLVVATDFGVGRLVNKVWSIPDAVAIGVEGSWKMGFKKSFV
jgi:hypothetical protein